MHGNNEDGGHYYGSVVYEYWMENPNDPKVYEEGTMELTVAHF